MNKKTKTKPKGNQKEGGADAPRGQVVKIKQGKARAGWFTKVPPIKQYWTQTKNFLAEAVQELKKVTWPDRKETLGTTGVVLVLVFFIAGYLGFVDFLLSHLVRYFIH
ncbi:MAG: preprotein translocase subunit SecE [Thermodesulfobacteriota bacterium]